MTSVGAREGSCTQFISRPLFSLSTSLLPYFVFRRNTIRYVLLSDVILNSVGLVLPLSAKQITHRSPSTL
jgi:hypothetical protein